MKNWVFNPFKFIAGKKALWLGIGAMLITAMMCFLKKQHLDGVIDVHFGKESKPYIYFIEPLIDWLSLVLPLYIFGRIFSHSSIRFIDVAGTSALARYPMFFVVLLNMFFPHQIKDPQKLLSAVQADPQMILQIIIIALLIIPIVVWTVALMYNAYSISVNLKGAKATWSFIASILIAEILSKIVLSVMN